MEQVNQNTSHIDVVFSNTSYHNIESDPTNNQMQLCCEIVSLIGIRAGDSNINNNTYRLYNTNNNSVYIWN